MAVSLGASISVIYTLYDCHPGSVKEKSSSGDTPLHMACAWGRASIDVLRFMSEIHPPALREKNNNGSTPLHRACGNWGVTLDVAECLPQRYPAALKEKNKCGDTPLMVALRNHASPCVIQFLKRKEKQQLLLDGNRSDNNDTLTFSASTSLLYNLPSEEFANTNPRHSTIEGRMGSGGLPRPDNVASAARITTADVEDDMPLFRATKNTFVPIQDIVSSKRTIDDSSMSTVGDKEEEFERSTKNMYLSS